MTFQAQPATRQGVIPLVGLYSESGCGKTYSALLLARGFVGPTGKIIMVDTESRRGSLYSDVIPGGYDVINMDAPFTPARYVDAIQSAEAQGAQIIVVDSMSHEWEAIGGVCDTAGENEARSGKPGLHNWRTPKMEHSKLVTHLLRTKVPVICCIRAKFKTRQKKDAQGKTIIIKDDFTSPIQAEDFIFELTVHAEILPDHTPRMTKISHPALGKCFPTSGPITTEHGKLLAAWCASGSAPAATFEKAFPNTDLAHWKGQLWKATELIHHGNKDALEQWLWDENLLPLEQSLADLNAAQIRAVTDKAVKKLPKP